MGWNGAGSSLLGVEGVVPILLVREGVCLDLILRLLSHKIALYIGAQKNMLDKAMQSTTLFTVRK